MSDTPSTVSTMDKVIVAKILQEELQRTIKGMPVMEPLAWVRDVSQGTGKAVSFGKNFALSGTSTSEGTATAAAAWTPTEALATLAVQDVQVVVSKLADFVANPMYRQEIIKEAVDELIDDIDTALAALLSGFSTTAGTSTQNMTLAVLDAAVVAYAIAAKRHRANAVICAPPQLTFDIDQQLTDATIGLSTALARQDLIGMLRVDGGDGSGLWKAVRGHYKGIPWIEVDNAPSMNSGADQAGAIFTAGQMGALGMARGWAPNVEVVSTLPTGILGVRYSIDAGFGVVEVNDTLGITLINDAP